MGVMDSIAHFNDGDIATLNIFEEIGLSHGYYTTIGWKDGNEERCDNSVSKSGEGYCTRRKYIRGMKKSKGDTFKKKEGETYGAGKFTTK